jgi:hypothetical protein
MADRRNRHKESDGKARKTDGAATRATVPSAAPGETFAELLDWHLVHGTRPQGGPISPGVRWGTEDFAYSVQTSERSVRNWRAGSNVPLDLASIERELFGTMPSSDAPQVGAWRSQLRDIHRVSQLGKRVDSAVPRGVFNVPPGLARPCGRI